MTESTPPDRAKRRPTHGQSTLDRFLDTNERSVRIDDLQGEHPPRRYRLIPKRGSTLHDFPYASPTRKCPHRWIINLTPPGTDHCIHNCVYCYARDAIFARATNGVLHIYNNLPALVRRDLKQLRICPPISISNITDPCQPVPPLRAELSRLVELLIAYGVTFMLITKGDPRFLLETDSFRSAPVLLAETIEGPPEILSRLSPRAASFSTRIQSVEAFVRAGVRTVVRIDPIFIHLYRAVYGERWFEPLRWLLETLHEVGVRHVITSTGRLRRHVPKRGENEATQSLFDRVGAVIAAASEVEYRRFVDDYTYARSPGCSAGYFLHGERALRFHRRLRKAAEAIGLTYATCLEPHCLHTDETCDSDGLVSCEGGALPFTRKGADGRFHPIAGCTGNCLRCSTGDSDHNPPCGRPTLRDPRPFTRAMLR